MSADIIPGFHCPTCGQQSLTYNGNYYCLNGSCWGMDPEVGMFDQPTWELELMVAYMKARDAETFAIYIDPIVAELEWRKGRE